MGTRTYVVTGGAGFIGSHVAEALLKQGQRVIVFDDFNEFYNPVFKRENIEWLRQQGGFQLIELDITDAERLQTAFANLNRIDGIIHLAARAGVRPSLLQPHLYAHVNVTGTVNLLEMARRYQVPKFIFASSSSVYGNQEKVPFSETDPVDQPISPYAATKRAGELLVATYRQLYQFDTVCLRFFTVYGPRGRPDMAPYLFTDLIWRSQELTKYGDGESRRDYTYIDDIIHGVMATLDKNFGYEIINLGNSQTITLNDFISLVEQLLKKKARIKQLPPQPGDVRQTYADVSKASRLLNYQPQTSFAQGLERFITWYREHRG